MEATCSLASTGHCARADMFSGSKILARKWACGTLGSGGESMRRQTICQLQLKHRGECRGRRFGRRFITNRPSSRRATINVNCTSVDDDGNNEISLPPALDEILDYLHGEKQGQEVEISEPRSSEGIPRSEANDGLEEGYLGMFVRLLGLDNPSEDREEAVRALWRHSMGGKEFIDQIIYFPGCLNLIVSLLPSNRPETSEAAAGLLRNISSVSSYRAAVAEAGAIEEISGLLTRRLASSEVREQATCALWNLSAEEDLRVKLVEPDILQVLFSMLGSDVLGEREAAAGVIANLTDSPQYHDVLVEAGIIPKFAKILLSDSELSNASRQEVRSSLLKLAKDQNLKLLIIEEGLIPVPSIGASAYRSFKPLLQVPAELPETVKLLQPTVKVESKFGAGELLLGLNSDKTEIDDATCLIMEGRVRQQFLARIGLLEKIPAKSDRTNDEKFTLLPWWDGIPRLILILGLDDPEVARQAALVIAEIAISEENRQAVYKAGAIPHLVRLLGSGDEDATAAAALALDKLAISHQIRRSVNAHDAPSALVAILKAESAPEFVKSKAVGALFRLSQTGEAEMNDQAVAIPGLLHIVQSENASEEAKEEAEEILEELAKVDPKDKIIAAGGLHPLIQIMMTGSPDQAEKAAGVLENLATGESNIVAILDASVQSALMLFLDVDIQDEVVKLSNGKTLSRDDSLMVIRAALRLLEKLAISEKVRSYDFAPLLKNILQSDVPARIKERVSACQLKLEQCEYSSLSNY